MSVVSYIFSIAFALWPLLAFLGGGGFSGLVALAALSGLAFMRPPFRIPFAALVFLAVLVWAAVTETWSPSSRGLFSGSLASGDFAIHSAAIRIVATGLLSLILFFLALRMQIAGSRRAVFVLRIAVGVQFIILAICAAFTPFVSELFAPISDPITSQPQNLIRNANILAVILPVLTAPLWVQRGLVGPLVAAAVTAAAVVIALDLDALAGAMGVMASIGGLVLARLIPRRALGLSLAALALTFALAPVWVTGITKGAQSLDREIGGSTLSRVWSWAAVTDKIMEKPITGHGLEASKTWRETFAETGGWTGPAIFNDYPVIPGHPHNMPLQAWAETGAVGALLIALALGLLAWRVRDAGTMAPDARLAGTMMVATGFLPICVSYSIWNEAFWAMMALAAVAVILTARQQEAHT